MLSSTAKLALGVIASNFAVTVDAWWIFGGAAADPEPAKTIEDIEIPEIIDEEPVMTMSRETLDEKSNKGS